MTDEEPVGFLGGSTGDDPYAVDDPYADPYAATQAGDEEIVGMLGGATGEEELPALPAAEDASYSASDFMEGADDGYADPYADPYAEGAAYDDPYALPPQDEGYDDYEGYDEAADAESDPSYFDSMGHEDYDPHATDVATRTAEPETQYDDAAPKTISQQDAESIIRRITTKRILPPDQEVRPAPRQLTPSGGGLRIWPILVALLLLGGMTVWVFREPIAQKFPQFAGILGVKLEEEKPKEIIKTVPREVKLKRALLKKVLVSELKAFGLTEEDLKASKPKPAPGGDAPAGGDKAPAGDGAGGDETTPDGGAGDGAGGGN